MGENLITSRLKKQQSLVEQYKVPPHSIEAEQSILGGLLLNNQAWEAVVDVLSAADFYRHSHQIIFKAIATLETRAQPFDVLTVSEVLKTTQELEKIGGELYLFELTKNTFSIANIKTYAQIVRERSILRQLIQAAQEIANNAFNPEGQPCGELLDLAERKIFEIAATGMRGSSPRAIADLLGKAMDKIDHLFQAKQDITGLASGYYDFDKMTAGLQPADLIIVAGRPSMGKTTFAMNVAEYAAINSKLPVLIFSMEMPSEALALRMLSSLGRVEQHKLRTGRLEDEDWPRLGSTIGILSEAQMFIDDTPGLTPGELRSRARRVAREQGQLGLIVIDYLQLMRVPNLMDNRAAEISEISRSLKMLAKELNVPVLALSQLNRSLEQRADKRPVMSDLRESGAIEQDADLIAFIYRDEVYHPESRDKGIAEVIIGKHRNGPIGKIRLSFFGQYTRFENLEERYAN